MERAKKVEGGDLSELEGMLANQATTLDVIFNTTARRSAMNMGDYIGSSETYMKLALRAQSQCRTTVAELAEIKNPKAAGQANISNGPQQVNNGVNAPVGASGTEADQTLHQTNFQKVNPMSYIRTPEHKRMQAERVQRWKPWECSTGPKSAEGRAIVSRNA